MIDDDRSGRWRGLLAKMGRGEPLSDDDAAYVDDRVHSEPMLAREEAVWFALGRFGDAPLSGERSDAELGRAALVAFQQGAADRFEPERPSSSRWRWIGALALTAAAGLVVGLVGRTEPPSEPPSIASHGTSTPNPIAAAPVEAGELDEAQCVTFEDGDELCLLGEGTLRSGTAVAELRRGTIRARSSRERPVLVETPLGRLQAEDARFDATVSEDGRTVVVSVHEGRVAAWREDRYLGEATPSAPLVLGGKTVATSRSRSTRKRDDEPRSTPALRLRDAQTQLAEGRLDQAASTYRALIEDAPGSPEARSALVSLGRLELRRGRAAEALASFDRYLGQGGGALAEEAAYQRILALRALDRPRAEREAIERFLAAHPEGLYGPRLRSRLAALVGSPGVPTP